MANIPSTWLRYDRAATNMSSLAKRADTLNTQISSTKRLQTASDDPVAYQRLRGLATQSADSGAYASNVKVAQGVLQQADTALGAMVDRLQRAKEISVAAGNPTIDAASRGSYADELEGILADVLAQANTTDARGQPLFGGAVTQTVTGVAVAAGAVASIPIGDGQSVVPSARADAFLVSGSTDVVKALTDMVAALRTGTGAIDATDLDAVTDKVLDTRASLGARAARVDLQEAQLKTADTQRETQRSGLEDTDIPAAITELQKTMTVLQATQASFSKLSSLSLFDYLR